MTNFQSSQLAPAGFVLSEISRDYLHFAPCTSGQGTVSFKLPKPHSIDGSIDESCQLLAVGNVLEEPALIECDPYY